jgi:hypothetical protein
VQHRRNLGEVETLAHRLTDRSKLLEIHTRSCCEKRIIERSWRSKAQHFDDA